MASETVFSDVVIRVTIECNTAPGIFHFEVHPSQLIREFLHHVLETLAQGENRARVTSMQSYYEPVLELCEGSTSLPLDSSMTLEQAGIEDKSICRIAAKPRKERIMFCSNS